MATQRNVLIVGGYARQNAGDAALLHAIILQVERAFPGCLVEIAGMEDPRLHRDFEGVQNLGSMRRYADDRRYPAFSPCRPQGPCPCHRNVMVRRARPLVPLARPPGFRRKSARSWRRSSGPTCSVSLVAAGGYLQGAARPGLGPRVIYQLLPLILAQRLGTPVVCAPQSYGPFGGKLVTWIVGEDAQAGTPGPGSRRHQHGGTDEAAAAGWRRAACGRFCLQP